MVSLVITCAALFVERFPLGPLGATAEVEPGSDQATVVAVVAEGPASRADVRVGDRLVAIDGVAFPEHSASIDAGGRGPQKRIGEAIDAACAEAAGTEDAAGLATLRLEALRGEEPLDLLVSFPARASLRGPARAAGRAALRAAAAHQLVARCSGAGFWNSPVGLSGDRVVTAWAVVAMLAQGDPEHLELVDRAASWLRGPNERAWLPEDFSKGPDNLGNWALTSTVVALAEHDLAREQTRHRPIIEHVVRGLTARMDEAGRFGHDVTVGYGGKGFNVINTLTHLAWAYAEISDVPVDEAAWGLSMEQIRKSVDPNGGVRYWTLPGTGTSDASLRTGSMALSLHLRGGERELADGFVRYLDEHAARTREAHAVGSLGMLVAAPALRAADPGAYERFLEEWRWYLSLMWGPGDRIEYIGGKRNNGGDSYLGFDTVAAVIALQLLACGDERLRMHRRAGVR